MTGSPFVHRLLAFALVLFGGHAVGAALRSSATGPLLDFGPLYVGAWMVRDGRAWADLYDPAHLAAAVSTVAPAGRILDLGATPPLLVAFALPFTACTAEYGKFLFALAGTLVLLLGLGALGAGRTLGWNRSEWIGFAGLVLGSHAAREAVLRGSPATWTFGLLGLALGAHGLARPGSAAILSAIAALATPLGLGPLAVSCLRGPRSARFLALGVFLVGILVAAGLLGVRGIANYGSAVLEEWARPSAFDPSWVARALRFGAASAAGDAGTGLGGGGVDVPTAGTAWLAGGASLLGVVLLAALLVVRLRRDPLLWGWAGRSGSRRANFDPPRLSGLAPALFVALLLVGTVQPLRGAGLYWGVPVWAALGRLDAKPSAGLGLALFAVAVLVLLPAPLAARLGSGTSADLALLGSVGLVLWWWQAFRGSRSGPVARAAPATSLRRAP